MLVFSYRVQREMEKGAFVSQPLGALYMDHIDYLMVIQFNSVERIQVKTCHEGLLDHPWLRQSVSFKSVSIMIYSQLI